jgi:hypothetical protein
MNTEIYYKSVHKLARFELAMACRYLIYIT